MQVGLILAAGSGSRMGRPKATLEIDGERLVDRAVSIFHEAGIKNVYVVLGAWQGFVPGATVVVNTNWETGMGSSLVAGLEAISENLEIIDVVISLVDLPGMTSEAIRKVAESSQDIAMGEFSGKPGHPAKFARKHWQAIIDSAEGDFGARNFLKGRDDVSYISLDHLATGKDVDTPEDLAGFKGDI
jgi:CTP:molybdopterin cytidylyltransferase MocA